MAPKYPKASKRLLEDPPPAGSSSEDESESEAVNEEESHEENGVVERPKDDDDDGDDDDEEEEEEEEDGDEDEEEEEVKKEKPSAKNGSGSGSDSDSETDTDSDNTIPPSPSTADFTIKPSKPMEDSSQPKTKKPTKPITTPVSKRAPENELNGKDSKKKKVSDDEDPKKASGFQRLWSEDDQIAILKGFIEYRSQKGLDPLGDMGAFLEFIKDDLHVAVKKDQLHNKCKRLKQKYQKNAEKVEDLVFSKPYERKLFELSKKIWGSEAASADANSDDNNAKSAKRKSKKVSRSTGNGEVEADPDDFWSKYPLLKDSFRRFVNTTSLGLEEVLRAVPSSKLKELENRWKKLHMEELELQVRRNILILEQSQLGLNSI